MFVPMTPVWEPPLAGASGFCSSLEITWCITQGTEICGLFTRGLQAVGTKRHKLLLRNGDCTAHVAVTPFTNFLIAKKKSVWSYEHKCLQKTSVHSYVEMYKMAHLGQAGGCSPPRVPRHLQQH